jgi:hypothetical protein
MPRGRAPRAYPEEVVELVCGMYRDGMTVAEIRKAAPAGYRVQTILERHLPERRPAIKRDQRGEKNVMWKANDCGYQAAHLRIAAINGKASSHACADCDQQANDWSYVHNCADEVQRPGRPPYCTHADHYVPRCRPCHRAYDKDPS